MLKTTFTLTTLSAVLITGMALSATAEPSALDQLKSAAGGNASHVFDGTKSNGSPPASAPSAPPAGSGVPVQSSGSGGKKK
jgi:hypothetical protein